MFTFIFPDWSMTAIRYDCLDMMSFRPLGDGEDCHGDCVVTLACDRKVGQGAIAVITGRNLHDLFAYLGYHQVHWIWEMPKDRAATGDGAPVVHAIEIKEANPQNLEALLP